MADEPNNSAAQNPQVASDVQLPTTPISNQKPLRYKNILCIEDEHFIGELYARALSRAGYNAKIITDGGEGLKEALTDQYDIILLDIMVPNITGIELLKRLRGSDKPIHAKIIITTNLEQKEETRAAIEKQADGYIVKAEVTPKEIVKILQSLED